MRQSFKKLTIAASVLFCTNAFCQSIDSTSQCSYIYRLGFENVNNRYSAAALTSPLKDLFHQAPVFYDDTRQFIFVSEVKVEEMEIGSRINDSFYRVIFFKRQESCAVVTE